MDCLIPQRSIKLFHKIIQCLSKIGEMMNIEVKTRQVILRAVSESRSAFTAFTMDQTFFEEFNVQPENIGNIRVPLKPCLAVFRSINTIETCNLKIDLDESRLIFNILCKHGIKKVYKLAFEESQIIQAIYNKNYPSKIVSRPRLLLEAINNFHSILEEVTLTVQRNQVKIKSYIDESRHDAGKLLRTELTINSTDFEEYSLQDSNISLTFCLKEMKAILSFCEVAGQPIIIQFDQPGRPMLLSLKFFSVIEADFVLATLIEQNEDSSQSSNSMPSSITSKVSHSGTPSGTPSSYSGSSSSSMSASSSNNFSKVENYPVFKTEASTPDSSSQKMDLVIEEPKFGSQHSYVSGHVSGSDEDDDPIPKVKSRKSKKPLFTSDFMGDDDSE